MIRTIATALAAAALMTAAAADAKTKCSCAPVKKHRVHHRAKHVAKRVTVRSVDQVVVVSPEPASVVKTVTKSLVESETYVAPDTMYLPDPIHSDAKSWIATDEENRVASELNASLDEWRTCGWSGYEQPAAAFVAWSRTHLERDPADPDTLTIAWKPMAYESVTRTEDLSDPRDRSVHCAEIRPDRAAMRVKMDSQMNALARLHATSHRH
jgi:hypothetical protein